MADLVYPLPLTIDRNMLGGEEKLIAEGVRDVVAVGYLDLPGWLVCRVPGRDRALVYYCNPFAFAELEGTSGEDIDKLGRWLNERRSEQRGK